MGKLEVTKLTGEHSKMCDICDAPRTQAVISIAGVGVWAPTLCLCEAHSRELLIKLGELLKSKKGEKSERRHL